MFVKMSPRKKWLALLCLCLQFFFLLQGSLQAETSPAFEASRAHLLSYLVRRNFTEEHYSRRPINDELSKAAFQLFMKQLDSQKRFLLKDDVAILNAFSDKIDDEVNTGVLVLPKTAQQMLNRRVSEVRDKVKELIAGNFDFDKEEFLESDPEKREFCTTMEELTERWRLLVKFQLMSRYISLEEIAKAEETKDKPDAPPLKNGVDPARMAQAREKVLKNLNTLFDRMLETTEREHYERFFSAFARAFDPHSDYMPPPQKEDFDIHMRGSLEGIGAKLQEEDGFIKVMNVIPGGAAYRQGELDVEDIILKVAEGKDGEPVEITDMAIRDAVALIRGKKGSLVRLTVKKTNGRIVIIPIIRDVVQIEETFVKSALLDAKLGGHNIGYIRIPSFYRDFSSNDSNSRNSTDDMKAAIKDLESGSMKGLILDLRNNGGGSLPDAVTITGLFIDKGPVVQVKSSDGTIKQFNDREGGSVYKGPLVVLVNQFSASASEIVAGALQDYGRALIVGSEHTHGKGTVQTITDLDTGHAFVSMDQYKPLGAVKLTIQKFYRVNGDSTQYRGIVPDIVLPDRMAYAEFGEQHLDNSLPWDSVAPTPYDRLKLLPSVAELKARSQERVRNSEEFKKISEDALKVKERRENTLQPLRMTELRKEIEEAKEAEKLADPLHEGVPKNSGKNGARLSEEDIRKKWLEDLAKDPYVKEASRIMGDVVVLSGNSVESASVLR